MSPWQVKNCVVSDAGEQMASMRKRACSAFLQVLAEESHAEIEGVMINACRERGQGEKDEIQNILSKV